MLCYFKISRILLYCMLLQSVKSIVLCCIVLYCIVLHCLVLSCIVLYCLVLSCIVLCCIVLVLCDICQNIFKGVSFENTIKLYCLIFTQRKTIHFIALSCFRCHDTKLYQGIPACEILSSRVMFCHIMLCCIIVPCYSIEVLHFRIVSWCVF